MNIDSKIKEVSGSFWVQNANYPNNYTLEKETLILGKSQFHDRIRLRIFGWTTEVESGDRKGMIEANIPCIPSDEGEDREVIGYFDSVQDAMKIIVERNHPDYGFSI